MFRGMAIAGASDALDGWMARRFQWMSRFGAAMDPVADKLLVATTFIIFTLQGHIPVWVAAIVLGRDAVIMTGAGVEVSAPTDIDGVCRQAFFSDPTGNLIELNQPL